MVSLLLLLHIALQSGQRSSKLGSDPGNLHVVAESLTPQCSACHISIADVSLDGRARKCSNGSLTWMADLLWCRALAEKMPLVGLRKLAPFWYEARMLGPSNENLGHQMLSACCLLLHEDIFGPICNVVRMQSCADSAHEMFLLSMLVHHAVRFAVMA